METIESIHRRGGGGDVREYGIEERRDYRIESRGTQGLQSKLLTCCERGISPEIARRINLNRRISMACLSIDQGFRHLISMIDLQSHQDFCHQPFEESQKSSLHSVPPFLQSKHHAIRQRCYILIPSLATIAQYYRNVNRDRLQGERRHCGTKSR